MGAVVSLDAARSRRAARPVVSAAPSDPADVARRIAGGERLLTAAELARLVGRSTRQIRRDVVDGMPCVPIGARGRRYFLSDVLAWHQRQEGDGADTPSCA